MPITLLDPNKHQRDYFDCGNPSLNIFLKQIANQQSHKHQARTYVLTDNQQPERIIGFYTLTLTQLAFTDLPETLQKKYRNPPYSGLLARLAIDKNYQGQGYGKQLLLDAFHRLYQASQLIGFPIIVVDTKDGKENFYKQYGFIQLSENRNRWYILIDSIKKYFYQA